MYSFTLFTVTGIKKIFLQIYRRTKLLEILLSGQQRILKKNQ